MAEYCINKSMAWGLMWTVVHIIIFHHMLSQAQEYDGCCQGLTSFPTDILGNTSILILNQNSIQSLPIIADILPMLVKCLLDVNQITHIRRTQFSGMSNLYELVISDNPLVMVEFPTDVPALSALWVDNIASVIEASQLVADDGTLLINEGSCDEVDVWCWILSLDLDTILSYRSCYSDGILTYSSQLIYLKGKWNIFLFNSRKSVQLKRIASSFHILWCILK